MAKMDSVKELFEYLITLKRYWLIPLFLILGVASLLMIVVTEHAAISPVIYAMF